MAMIREYTAGVLLTIDQLKEFNALSDTPIFAIDEDRHTFKVINKKGLVELLERLKEEANND
ncbi:hypothetical protein [Fructobacillus parabroussonetiae]|uniref:CBS domain-containing protein n=1 Tax=Fructobacillus parabroussonetiae TaxID=2713174 RepID=A0ABS5QY60_9LACO|nr:hypothetical protein [Fructobacillus parabroussonetiae]MBS9337214.1 hypothetical protein [Fructobacillus parabroussonetiae]